MRSKRERQVPPVVVVREVRTASRIEDARALFREYRAWLVEHREVTAFGDAILERGLAYLDREIADLPGDYGPPGGALLIAYDGSTPVGCAGLHRLGSRVAEVKRVYVRPTFRGGGVGRRLTERALRAARRLGYRRVVLDTIPTMKHAIAMYRTMGFQPTERYWPHPVADALFFEYRWDRPVSAGAGGPPRESPPPNGDPTSDV